MNSEFTFDKFSSDLKEYCKDLFIEKYLFVYNNINEIYNMCSNNIIFYQVLESLLLENSEIYKTYGYKYLRIIFDRFGYSNNKKINFNDALRGLVFYILNENDSHNRSLKCYDIERYLDLNGQINNYDCDSNINVSCHRTDNGVSYNAFIREISFLSIDEKLINQLFERMESSENKTY